MGTKSKASKKSDAEKIPVAEEVEPPKPVKKGSSKKIVPVAEAVEPPKPMKKGSSKNLKKGSSKKNLVVPQPVRMDSGIPVAQPFQGGMGVPATMYIPALMVQTRCRHCKVINQIPIQPNGTFFYECPSCNHIMQGSYNFREPGSDRALRFTDAAITGAAAAGCCLLCCGIPYGP